MTSRCKSFLIVLLSFQNQQFCELLQLTLLREAETGMLNTCTTLIKRGTQQELMFYRAINYFKGGFDMLLLGVTHLNLHLNISRELVN